MMNDSCKNGSAQIHGVQNTTSQKRLRNLLAILLFTPIFGLVSCLSDENEELGKTENPVSDTGTVSTISTVKQTKSGVRSNAYAGKLVRIAGACYKMRWDSADVNEQDKSEVCVQDFEIGVYEVTQEQWQVVMGNNPSTFKGCNRCPVENVAWTDIIPFLKKLNQMTGETYRLPSETEWEFACRSGGKEQINCGAFKLGELGWFGGNSGERTHVVGRKSPNELGLYDFSGNVWEWVSEFDTGHGGNVRRLSKQGEVIRLSRGCSWTSDMKYCGSGDRRSSLGKAAVNVGFRLARSL